MLLSLNSVSSQVVFTDILFEEGNVMSYSNLEKIKGKEI